MSEDQGAENSSRLNEKIAESLKKIYDDIDKHGVKKGLDSMGLDGFTNHCAKLAAVSGAVTGFGGAITMIVGVPIDVINNIVQQFRVTLAIIYDRKRSYEIDFEEFMKIVGMSVGVEVGVTVTKTILIRIAGAMILRMTASTAGKAIPIFGSLVGASTNYAFIKLIAKSVKQLDL